MTAAPGRVDLPDRVHPAGRISASQRSAVYALAEALFATDAGAPPPERLAWLVDDLDDFLAQAGPRARGVFTLCLTALALGAPLFARRLGGFSSMPLSERSSALERLERSPLALALFGAKALLCIVYYEHPEAALHAGNDGLCLRRKPERVP